MSIEMDLRAEVPVELWEALTEDDKEYIICAREEFERAKREGWADRLSEQELLARARIKQQHRRGNKSHAIQ
jgi:hypothetical protein